MQHDTADKGKMSPVITSKPTICRCDSLNSIFTTNDVPWFLHCLQEIPHGKYSYTDSHLNQHLK